MAVKIARQRETHEPKSLEPGASPKVSKVEPYINETMEDDYADLSTAVDATTSSNSSTKKRVIERVHR